MPDIDIVVPTYNAALWLDEFFESVLAQESLGDFRIIARDDASSDATPERLAAWQELIAEFFDAPDCRKELESLRSVDVTAGSDAEMYYLLGWLASRLDWAPVEKNTLSAHGRNVTFSMIHDGPPRRLSKVVLASPGATFTASVATGDSNSIGLCVTGTSTCGDRVTPVHTVDLASLVERAILSRTRDEVFIESLNMAKHIIERQVA